MNKTFILTALLAVAVVAVATAQTVYADTGLNIHGNYNPKCKHHCGGDNGGNGGSSGSDDSGGGDSGGGDSGGSDDGGGN